MNIPLENFKYNLLYQYFLLKQMMIKDICYYTSVIFYTISNRIFIFPQHMDINKSKYINTKGITFCKEEIFFVCCYRDKIHVVYENNVIVKIFHPYNHNNQFFYYAVDMDASGSNEIKVNGHLYRTNQEYGKTIEIYYDAIFTVNTVF